MPPKSAAKAQKGQDKAAEKQKQKIIEDKTFGLKNKNKSKAVQKYIKSVQTQVSGNQTSEQKQKELELKAKEEKKKITQQQALLDSLFKGTENIKKLTIDNNAKKNDPRSIRMDQKIDLYVDQRDQREQIDGCENWDLEKFERVIKTRHSSQKNSTDIVCRFFLDAVEKRTYGWFWVCPNGGDECKYKHVLPPGYVLKPRSALDDPDLLKRPNAEPIEEIIERERAALPPGGRLVTYELLCEWKKKCAEEKERKRIDAEKKAAKSGRNIMSGRALFAFQPDLFVDDDAAADDDAYGIDEEEWNRLQNEQGEHDSSESGSDAEDHEDDRENFGRRRSSCSSINEDESSNPTSKKTDTQKVEVEINNKNLFLEECPELDDIDALDD